MTAKCRTLSFLSLAAVAVLLLPAAAALGAPPAPTDEPLLYLVQAPPLSGADDIVTFRFEAREGRRVVASETLAVRFEGGESVVVPIPGSVNDALAGVEAPELRLLVFAGDVLMNAFDTTALAGYQRGIRNTHRPEVEALIGDRNLPNPALKIDCGSPCGGGCGPFDDYDCDGVNNLTDNCTDDPNSNQADCDGDGRGDVCDILNGVFQPAGSVSTCMTDKDWHVLKTDWEHHVEQRLVDVTSCHSPDRWDRSIRSEGYCCNKPPCTSSISDHDCCLLTIGTSIQQVGDDKYLWCGDNLRNHDLCH